MDLEGPIRTFTMTEKTEPWLNKFQPLMLALPLVLIAFFFWVGYRQSEQFREAVVERSRQDINTMLRPTASDSKLTAEGIMLMEQWRTLAVLEQETLSRRYQQAGLLLVSRIFTKYLGFLTGMIMAIAGAWFIIGRIREEQSQVGGVLGNAKLNVRSSSPGILFGVLGTLLMGVNIVQHASVETVDRPLYLHPANIYLLRQGALVLDTATVHDLIISQVTPGEQKVPAELIPKE